MTNEVIYTVHHGNNSGMIKSAVDLYFCPGDSIADVTYGKGAFWKEIDKANYQIVGSDIQTGTDFKNLPYPDNSFDHGVIDPPYSRINGLGNMVSCYRTSGSNSHKDIIGMYREGLRELSRITRKKGYIFCKCQDEVSGRQQKWSHIEIFNLALELGLYAKDLFILVNTKNPKPTFKQLHARKNHSYLWVFQVT